jgi:ABC-type phosphate transport system substrate-binding protein
MKSHFARGLGLACTAALATVAVAAPGTALAKGSGTQCTGVNIEGQGASTQKIIQINFWNKLFNESTDKYACNGTQGTKGTPKITYTNTGSGAGLESWGEFGKVATNYGPTNGYIGTSETPNAEALGEIASHESPFTAEQVATIPVVQLAVAIYVNLPTGCTSATSSGASGRLVLNQSTLKGIYEGTINKWSQITDDGDTLSGPSCTPASDTITPVVRVDQAGTTHILKRFLGLLDSGTLETSKGPETWDDLSEGALNVVWPTALNPTVTAKKGDAEEAAKVAATPGSIGYSNLAELRATNKFSKSGEGGAGTAKFWVEIQNEEKKGKFKYQDPATNGDVEAAAEANCAKTVYSNGANPFPPPAVTEPFNEVTTKTSEKTYPLCGFTYVLTTLKYSLFPETTSGEAETVKDFLEYVTDKKGGQTAIAGHDYEALPSTVDKEASKGGANLIGF